MNLNKRSILLLCALGAMSTGSRAETVEISGSLRTTVAKTLMPLGNGGSVITASNHGVAAISTSPPTLMDVKCVGMGHLPPEGDHATDFYCTFSANEEDRLDLKGTDGPAGGTATVIGGSGKWQGATGGGTFTRESSTETTSSSTFQLKLTTP
jgi:hypothetical protein